MRQIVVTRCLLNIWHAGMAVIHPFLFTRSLAHPLSGGRPFSPPFLRLFLSFSFLLRRAWDTFKGRRSDSEMIIMLENLAYF